MDQEQDILFGNLGIEEISPYKEFEDSYASYADVFNFVANGIAHVILSREKNVSESDNEGEVIERSIEKVLMGTQERRYPVRALIDAYCLLIKEFRVFLESNPSVYQKLSDRGLDISSLDYWSGIEERWMYTSWFVSDTELSLQTIGCTYLIVDRLWDVYQFAIKRNAEVYELTHDGCKLIGYTWKDYFRTIRYIPKMPFMILKAIVSFTIGMPMLGKNIEKRFNKTERYGAAFADYPYKCDHSGTIEIQQVPIGSRSVVPRMKRLYNERKMVLNLDDKYGLSVAVFDYLHDGKARRCVSYAGTRLGISTARKCKVMVQNVITDILQYLDVPSKTYFEAVGILNDVMRSYPNRRIYVFGHSLGGGLMQYSCAVMNDKRLYGYGYNSAGLSDNTIKTIPGYHKKQSLDCRIEHLCSLHDPVSRLGHTISNVKYVESVRGWKAHCLSQLNMKLNNGQELKVRVK